MGTRCICYREPTSSFWEAKLFYKRDHTAFISPYCLMGSLDCVETGCSEMEHQLRMFPVILSSKMELQSRIRCQWSYAGKLLGSVWFHIQKSHLACLECCVREREREREGERVRKCCKGHLATMKKEAWRQKASMQRIAEHKKGKGMGPWEHRWPAEPKSTQESHTSHYRRWCVF